MKVTIVGTGYVGLVTAVSLAILNHNVICVDINKEKISAIQRGSTPFFEPGVDEYLNKVTKEGLLTATTYLEDAVAQSNVVIIAVGTPTVDNRIDLSAIKKVSEQIGQALKKSQKYHIIVVKSTVLPGVTNDVIKPIIEKFSGKKIGEFGLCMNPEFLREGNALEDALKPDRIIIGQYDNQSGQGYAKIYKGIDSPLIFTNLKTAELTKYAANALFATLISFSNEISRISETTKDVDVVDVWKGVHLDKRLTPLVGKTLIKPGFLSYIFSGCGFGGSCFPKDIKALSSFAQSLGVETKLINATIDINQTQPQRVILHLKNALGDELKTKKIAILGLTFKPMTDDLRESPALTIINTLLSEGATVVCHDPLAYKGFPKELISLSGMFTNSIEDAIQDADAAVVVTSWEEYTKLTPNFFKKHMRRPIVVDGRRIYNKNSFLEEGVIYKGIGL